MTRSRTRWYNGCMNTPSIEEAFIGNLDVTPPPEPSPLEAQLTLIDTAVGRLIHLGDELVLRFTELERRFNALLQIAYSGQTPDILQERLPMEEG